MKNKANNYAFIDSQNVNLAIREQGWILDWKKFRRYLSDRFSVKKAFIFIGYIAGNESLYKTFTLSIQRFSTLPPPSSVVTNLILKLE